MSTQKGCPGGARVTAIVPTLGVSPWLGACLEALRREGGEGLEIVVVDQGPQPAELPAGLVDRVLRLETNLGFAIANNRALAATRGALVATVNDDAVVAEGWLDRLVAALEHDPRVAAAQGVNLQLDSPELADGCGLAWNRWWQAVQIGRGHPPPAPTAPAREIFGVSATAALYRREALAAVSPAGESFDERLGSYYEDVDLACRLRAAGWRAVLVPGARARHAGSTTGSRLGGGSRPWIYANRYLVLAKLWGWAFWPRLPWLWLRDVVDLCQALSRAESSAVRGIVAGWARALCLLPRFAHGRHAGLAPAAMQRFDPRQ